MTNKQIGNNIIDIDFFIKNGNFLNYLSNLRSSIEEKLKARYVINIYCIYGCGPKLIINKINNINIINYKTFPIISNFLNTLFKRLKVNLKYSSASK
jgi:hypothetical protein